MTTEENAGGRGLCRMKKRVVGQGLAPPENSALHPHKHGQSEPCPYIRLKKAL
ncbi:MAG: hypothetical protein IJD97_11405 [Clostridia bacterium]|nr:hypothetical protein [Clostridia bacterium]